MTWKLSREIRERSEEKRKGSQMRGRKRPEGRECRGKVEETVEEIMKVCRRKERMKILKIKQETYHTKKNKKETRNKKKNMQTVRLK